MTLSLACRWMDGSASAKLLACSCPASCCSFVSASHSKSNAHLCGFSEANCFTYHWANSRRYLDQNSLPPPHRTSNIIPSSLLILSLQNTKTVEDNFPILIVWLTPKFLCFLCMYQRSRGLTLSCTLSLLELADLDRVEIRWTCSRFQQVNGPHYHLM